MCLYMLNSLFNRKICSLIIFSYQIRVGKNIKNSVNIAIKCINYIIHYSICVFLNHICHLSQYFTFLSVFCNVFTNSVSNSEGPFRAKANEFNIKIMEFTKRNRDLE